MTVINNTLNYYQINANEYAKATYSVDMTDLYTPFLKKLAAPIIHHILDVGCGSGRDATYFASLGYQVTAIDASVNLIEWAKEHCSSNKIDWYALSFKDVKNQPWQGRFTGVWACASLLHVPFSELAAVIESLLYTLTEDGVLYASFKYGEGERIESERFFCDMSEERWTTIVSEIHHVIDCDIWLSEDKRPEHKDRWFNIIFKKST